MLVGLALRRCAFAWIVAVIIAGASALSFSPDLFNDGDTGWHLATGGFILDAGSVPDRDPFSFTFRGHPWVAHEWLADVAMAGLYRVGGWSALSLLFAAAIAATLILVAQQLLRVLAPRYVVLGLVGLAAVLAPGMLARPHVIAWLLLTVWMIVLLRARGKQEPPPIVAALIMLLWANVHASYLLGLGIAAILALEALIEERNPHQTIPGWLAFGVASGAAALITPHGFDGVLYPIQVSGMKILPLIQEWRPTRLPDDIAFALFGVGIGALAVWRWRRVGPVRLALLAGLGMMAILHSRHQSVFAIVTLLAILPRAAAPSGHALPSPSPQKALIPLLGLAVAAAGLRLAIPLERKDGVTYPGTIIAGLEPALRRQPVLNDYSFGGPLIQAGIAPFIDGRADMYGDDFTILHSRLTEGDPEAFRAAVQRWDLRWTILAPDTPLVTVLDQSPEWRRLRADQWAVVHVRVK